MTSDETGKVLIVGGYGQVGRSIAEQLAASVPNTIVVAGRSLDKARAAADEIGLGVEARKVDIFSADFVSALDRVQLVIACLDQDQTQFVEACLERGIHYVDISAHYEFLERVAALDEVARAAGATAVLSAGVCPGLTNLLAAHLVTHMERVDRVDVLVELGLGDHHGAAAVAWTLDNLDATFDVVEDGRNRSVRSLDEHLAGVAPPSWPKGAGYRFNLSDQHVLGRTLGVPTVSSWLRLSSRVVTWFLAKTARFGLAWLLRRRWIRRLAIGLLTRVHLGSDRCRVAVRAIGRTADGGDRLTASVCARKEAFMTAIVTAEMVRQVLAEPVAAGVFHSEQVISIEPVLDALVGAQPDTVVDVPLLSAAGRPIRLANPVLDSL